MMRLKSYSPLTGDVTQLGLPSDDLTTLTDLGEMLAGWNEGVIVFVDGLQKWETPDD